MIVEVRLELNLAKRLSEKLGNDHYDEDYASLVEILDYAIAHNVKRETPLGTKL